MASSGLKITFVRVVNEHLDYLVPYIHSPTLIVWGKLDKVTPLYMARRLHKIIDGSRLITYSTGHFAYLDIRFTQALLDYIRG